METFFKLGEKINYYENSPVQLISNFANLPTVTKLINH